MATVLKANCIILCRGHHTGWYTTYEHIQYGLVPKVNKEWRQRCHEKYYLLLLLQKVTFPVFYLG